MKKLIYLLAILPLFMNSCSDELAESEAIKIINERYDLPKDIIREVKLKDETFNVRNAIANYEQLRKQGILTYRTYKAFIGQGASASLTNKGKQYLVSENGNTIKVKVAKRKLGSITNIIKITDAFTEVHYTYIDSDISPFGRVFYNMKEEEKKGIAKFTKSNNGWIIKK